MIRGRRGQIDVGLVADSLPYAGSCRTWADCSQMSLVVSVSLAPTA